jgi:hypothetical protein
VGVGSKIDRKKNNKENNDPQKDDLDDLQRHSFYLHCEEVKRGADEQSGQQEERQAERECLDMKADGGQDE